MNPKTATLVRRHGPTSFLALGLFLGACADDAGQATLRVTAYGEEFIEDRIPADVLVDGWTLELSRFLVAFEAVEADGEPLEGSFVVDLTRSSGGEGHDLGVLTLPAEGEPRLSFRVAPPGPDASPRSATDDDVTTLVDAGASMWVAGAATKGTQRVSFTWAFTTSTHYVECRSTAELRDGEEASAQLTIHADHLFYDDLDSETPNVAFDLVAAADADGDGDVTMQELRATDITGQARYQVGSRDVTDLWSFIEVQTGTVGHIDGEGHCELGS